MFRNIITHGKSFYSIEGGVVFKCSGGKLVDFISVQK